ncbi:MAG: adenosine kinase, partial [Bacteroidales bacterium]|nr:adenosine kinase [Bacteroidales bacterium]
IGKIFDDEFGRFFRNDMISSNINPHFVFSENEDTGIATTLITDDGERTFATCLGAAATLTPAELDPNLFASYNFVHVEGYLIFNHDLILRVCQLAKEYGATVSMDMASYNVVMLNLDFMRDLLKNYVDIIFANEEEAKAFTGKEEHDALEILSGYCSTAIVKLGAQGSVAKQQGTVTVIPAIPANCIDSNGAGDIYASGFLYGLMNGLPVEKCGYMASRLAAELVETVGAKLSDAQWQKIRAEFCRNELI